MYCNVISGIWFSICDACIYKKKKNVMPVNQCKSIEIDFVAEIKSYMILFVEENEYTWLKQKFYVQLVLS